MTKLCSLFAGAIAVAALFAAAPPAVFIVTANAAAPMQKTPPPGFYRMMVGDFEVTVLSDGTGPFPMGSLLTNTTPGEVKTAFARAFIKDPVETSVNTFLVNTGTKLVMIDAGAGKLFGPTLGNLIANMKAAGYQPEQVDEIYITHMHGDHVGGLIGDKTAFPNAIVRADQRDADFWLSKENMEKAPAAEKDFFEGAMMSINPYAQAGRFKPFSGDTELIPGVRSMSTYGHTPGHSIYSVESKGERLVLWGDLMHVAAVQFAKPTVTIKFDTDAKAAMAQRQKAFADAAAKGYWVGAAHIPFPGIGHLRKDGRGYAFVPANYSVIR